MAKRKTATPAEVLRRYPFPDISDPYVYLASLNEPQNYAEERVVSRFNALVSFEPMFGKMEKINNNLDDALVFLKSVARSQRQHEVNLIQNQINSLDPNTEGEVIKQLQDELDSLLSSPENFNYLRFIKLLNNALTGLGRYEARLKNMFDKGANADPMRNLANALDTTIGDYIGRRTEFVYSEEELVRLLTFRFMEREAGQAFLKAQTGQDGAINIVAATNFIQQELARYLADNGLLKYSQEAYKDSQDFMKRFNDLLDKLDKFESDTHIEEKLYNNNVLLQLQDLYGIQVTKYARKGRITKHTAQGAKRRAELAPILPKSYSSLDPTVQNILKRIKVTSKGSKQVSFNDEVASLIIRNIQSIVHTGHTQGGTDALIHLGTLTTTGLEVDKDLVAEKLREIQQETRRSNSIHDAEKTTDIYYKALTDLSNKLTGLQKCFIVHETTKFYQSVERGRWYRNKKGFSGRSMNLFNYIDSMLQFGQNFGFSGDWLKFVAYQLPTDSLLGSSLVAPLETFFAVFGGLIMFDDFGIMARELVQDHASGLQGVENVHVYKLQDGYYPASYFLEQTYLRMADVKQELEKNNGVTAEIQQPTVNYSPEAYGGGSLAERWPKVRDKVKDNVHIKLRFAANFFELAEKIFNI